MKSKPLENYKKYIFIGIIMIALGVNFNSRGAIGTVLIALGGLFFIIGMRKKQSESNQDKS